MLLLSAQSPFDSSFPPLRSLLCHLPVQFCSVVSSLHLGILRSVPCDFALDYQNPSQSALVDSTSILDTSWILPLCFVLHKLLPKWCPLASVLYSFFKLFQSRPFLKSLCCIRWLWIWKHESVYYCLQIVPCRFLSDILCALMYKIHFLFSFGSGYGSMFPLCVQDFCDSWISLREFWYELFLFT